LVVNPNAEGLSDPVEAAVTDVIEMIVAEVTDGRVPENLAEYDDSVIADEL